MRKTFVLITVLFALSAFVFGQQDSKQQDSTHQDSKKTDSKGELFIGYSYMRSDLQNFDLGTQNVNGITLQATAFLHKNIGVTADVTRGTASNADMSGVDVNRYTYLFGPTYTVRTNSSFAPFFHVLFGADHERFSISGLGDPTSNAFASDFGGGFDVKATDRIAFRLGQFDYIHTNHADGENHFRYSAGVVFGF